MLLRRHHRQKIPRWTRKRVESRKMLMMMRKHAVMMKLERREVHGRGRIGGGSGECDTGDGEIHQSLLAADRANA
jgi:hypothetical protein